MDSKLIIIPVLLLLSGMFAGCMVAGGMSDMINILNNAVISSQAQENVGFFEFELIASYTVMEGMFEMTKIFNRATKSQVTENIANSKLELISPVPGVYYQAKDSIDDSHQGIDLAEIVKITGKNLKDKVLTISVSTEYWYLGSVATRTVQLNFGTDITDVDGDGVLELVNSLYLIRDETYEPFNLSEIVELVFAVGDTARAEVTIAIEP